MLHLNKNCFYSAFSLSIGNGKNSNRLELLKLNWVLVAIFLASSFCAFTLHGQPVYSKQVFNEGNGHYFTSIMTMEQDSSGVIWMVADSKLCAFRENKFYYYTQLKNGAGIFTRPTNIFINELGQLLAQNDKFIVKASPGGELVPIGERNLENDLKFKIDRAQFSNQLGLLAPNYGYHLMKVAEKSGRSDVVFERGSFFNYENGRKIRIADYSDSIIGEVLFNGSHYFFQQNEIVEVRNKMFVVRNPDLFKKGREQVILPNIKKIFFRSGKYYVVSSDGLFRLDSAGNKLTAKLLIAGRDLNLNTVNTMLVGENESWFLFGCEGEVVQFTKSGMGLMQASSHEYKSMNSLMMLNNKLYSNRGGYWNNLGVHNEGNTNYLYCYGFDYMLLPKNEILLSKKDAYYHLNSNFEPIGSMKKISFYCNYVRDEKGKVFLITKNAIYEWANNKFLHSNFSIRDTEEMDLLFNGAAYRDTLYVSTPTGIIRYVYGQKNPLPGKLLNGIPVRNIQVFPMFNRIFAFTEGNGVFVIQGEVTKKLNADIGGHLKNAHYFIKDSFNRVWIPTNSGILVSHLSEFEQNLNDSNFKPVYFYFKGPTDFSFIEFNGSALHSGVFDSVSRNWFLSSVKGVVYFNPNLLTTNFPKFDPIILQTNIDNKINTGFLFPSDDFQKVSYSISLPYVGNLNDFHLEYRVLPDYSTWQAISNNQEIVILRGSPGEKKLEIRYRRGFGPQEYNMSSWDFYVEPFWFENRYFQAIGVFILFGLIYTLFKYKSAVHKSRQQALEKIIKAKTDEVYKMVEDLRISEGELKDSDLLKEQLIKVLAHDIRSPLISSLFIAEHLGQLVDEVQSPKHNQLREFTSDLQVSLKFVYEYVNDFLTWYNHKTGIFSVQNADIDFSALLVDVINLYKPIIIRKGNEILFDVEDNLLISSDGKLLKIVLRNLLDNANKYTSRSQVVVRAKKVGEFVLFEVRNRADLLTEIEKETIQRGLVDFDRSKLESLSDGLGLKIIGYFSSVLELELGVDFPEEDIVSVTLKLPIIKT